MKKKEQILTTGAILFFFCLISATLVSVTHHVTLERIALEQRKVLLHTLNALIPAHLYDNQPVQDTIQVQDARLGRHPVTIYRARKNGHPVAAVLAVAAPDGYNGEIKLLVAVLENGALAGVRTVAHKETPGLGDKIELKKSDWILQFNGASLLQPDTNHWKVKKDGGHFQQLTGATITPRAIVKAVYKTLQYYRQQQKRIFANE